MDIAALRSEIDRIDADMLALLDKQIALAIEIAEAKVKQERPLLDLQREGEMLKSAGAAEYEVLMQHEAEEFVANLLPLTRSWVTRRRRAAHVQLDRHDTRSHRHGHDHLRDH